VPVNRWENLFVFVKKRYVSEPSVRRHTNFVSKKFRWDLPILMTRRNLDHIDANRKKNVMFLGYFSMFSK